MPRVEIAAFVVSCLAVVCAAAAFWYARGQKHAADRAASAAEQAASTATAAEERQQRAEERSRVPWSLTHVNTSEYVLGTHSAHRLAFPDHSRPPVASTIENMFLKLPMRFSQRGWGS